MNYKIVKLDRRHTGHEHFEHAIDVKNNLHWNGGKNQFVQAIEFQKCRNWFWLNYGPSAEYATWLKVQALPISSDIVRAEFAVAYWAWETGSNKLRIFIKDDAALTYFILANPQS